LLIRIQPEEPISLFHRFVSSDAGRKYSGRRDIRLNRTAQKNGALKKFEEQLVVGAIGFGPRSFCLWKYQEGKTRTSDPPTVTVGASMRMTRHLATSTPERAAARVTATTPPVAISDAWCPGGRLRRA
jgi:hypothetical protein